MNGRITRDHNKPWFTTYVWLLIVFWTLVISASLTWNLLNQDQSMREIAVSEARAYFNKDQAFRQWATSHGGVYVPSDERTPPSPYLTHVPDRDIETPSGIQLTLMNPAYAIRQMNEDFTELYGVAGHITSLKPLRPKNAPDDWERAALTAFHDGAKEVTEFTEVGGEPHLRLMRPMITTEECLKCHGHQGYQVGGVNGGVGVSVPMTRLLAVKRQQATVAVLGHGGLWLLGLLGIGLGTRQISRRIRERNQAEKEIERMGRMKRYLSPQVAETLLRDEEDDPFKTHRREVTVVFLDLRGFTNFSDSAEPEEVIEFLRGYHAEMGKLIFQFEGTLEHFAGDGIMVFFNDPIPREDHTEMAVRMTVEMQARAKALRPGWLKKGYDLDLGVGMAAGYATLGTIGFEGRMDYGAVGNVTNLAARLSSEAKGGQILTNQRTLSKIEDLVEAEPLEELHLKGFHRPVAVFNIVKLKE